MANDLVHAVVLVGVVVVLPLVFGGFRRWCLVGLIVAVSFLVLSGLAPWVPMVLAVAWASSLYWDVPALSVPDMARTHGVMNVVFVVAGLLERGGDAELPARAPTRSLHVNGAPS